MAPTPIEVLILLKLADQASREAEAAADKIGKKYKDLGATMQKIGVGMTAAVTAPFVAFAKSAIEGASDTEESLNKVRVVFGTTAKEIEAFAATAATSMGLSEQATLEAAGTFGNLLKGIGLSKDATRDMTKEVVQLAADLGSFNNLPTEEVLANIRSGLVGEAEPMRKFGVLINEAAVKAEAMALGLGNVKGELTESEKVQARFSLIMKQTTTAQGDFAKTADGLANSQKIAAAEMADLTAEMGVMLLPLMKEATTFVKGLMQAFMGLSPETKKVILIVVGLFAALGPLLIVFGTLLTVLPAIGAAMALLLGPIGLVIAAVALAAVAWSQNWGDIQGKTKAAVDFLQDIFENLQLVVLMIFRGIVLGVTGLVNGIIGVINGFIEKYNVLAGVLGLPLIGTIELITPNLSEIDAAINRVTRDRAARIFVNTYPGSQQSYPGVGMFHEGTPSVPRTGWAFVEAGERIISKEDNRSGNWGGGNVTFVINAAVIDERGFERFADQVGSYFTNKRRVAGLA